MTQTIERPQTQENGKEQLPAIAPPRLPYHPLIEQRFGIDRASWKALVEAIFPNATSVESVILALSYCRARKLDPFKRNVHIVPIWNRDLRCMVDTIWPGIGELRTTAFRTGQYAGRDDAEFGPIIVEKVGEQQMKFPEWCRVTLYRVVANQRVAFAGPKVYWMETYATAKRDTDTPNEMWASRPMGQLEKCAEAAALRAAFPEEIGTEYIADEARPSTPPKSVVSHEVESNQRGAAALMKQLEAQEEQPSPTTPAPSQQPPSSDVSPPASPETVLAQPGDEAARDVGGDSQLPPSGGDESQVETWPGTLPKEARADTAWIDRAIVNFKPENLTAHQARKAFHAYRMADWKNWGVVDQQEAYDQLVTGTFPWSKPAAAKKESVMS